MKRFSDAEVKKGAAFVKAAFALKLRPGEAGTFDCPICGHTAIAKAAPHSGHIHAACSGCHTAVMQ